MSRKNKNFESKRTELIERFETSSNSAYFDVEEFEIIIEYYLNFFDTESAEKALKIATTNKSKAIQRNPECACTNIINKFLYKNSLFLQ